MASETTCRQKVMLTCICPFFLLLGLCDNFSHSYSPCDEEGIPALGFWTQLNTQHWTDETAHRLLTQTQSRGRGLCARQGHIGVARGNRVNDQEVWRASFTLQRVWGPLVPEGLDWGDILLAGKELKPTPHDEKQTCLVPLINRDVG